MSDFAVRRRGENVVLGCVACDYELCLHPDDVIVTVIERFRLNHPVCTDRRQQPLLGWPPSPRTPTP